MSVISKITEVNLKIIRDALIEIYLYISDYLVLDEKTLTIGEDIKKEVVDILKKKQSITVKLIESFFKEKNIDIPVNEIEKILQSLTEEGIIIPDKVQYGSYIPAESILNLQKRYVQAKEIFGFNGFTAKEFSDKMGCSHNFLLAMYRYYDDIGRIDSSIPHQYYFKFKQEDK